jgi:UTP--glucose-1-phosphate uridylyltransferase
MASVTDGHSKEMLEVGGQPVIDWGIFEAVDAGVEKIQVVLSPGKEDLVRYIGEDKPGVEVAYQFVADGLAPAIALAGGTEPTIVILPDTIFFPDQPSRRIARALDEGFDIVLLTEIVASADVRKFGIILQDGNNSVREILEKPHPEATTSRAAVAGRYGLSARMMEFLGQTLISIEGESSEIPLTPILNLAIKNGFDSIALPTLPGERRFDCGSPDGYQLAREAIP